jgi:recombination associated protein RdgC
MDLLDLINEKRFLGQEYLTWLWFISETSPEIDIDGNTVQLAFDYNMQLECGQGEACKRITCKGNTAPGANEKTEAKMAIGLGKKIEQAKILLSINEAEFWLTSNGRLLSLTGVKMPRVVYTDDGGDEALEREGMTLERISLITFLTRTMDSIFRKFLMLRTDQKAWVSEVKKIREWAAGE